MSDHFAKLQAMREKLEGVESDLSGFGHAHREHAQLVEDSLVALRRFRDTLWALDKAFET